MIRNPKKKAPTPALLKYQKEVLARIFVDQLASFAEEDKDFREAVLERAQLDLNDEKSWDAINDVAAEFRKLVSKWLYAGGNR